MAELIFETSRKGRRCAEPPQSILVGRYEPEASLLREPPHLPELAEISLVRHYTGLSRRAYGVDQVFYPLGSCTMKYNPKINEELARLEGFAEVHPLQEETTVQGCMEAMFHVQEMLSEIAGMDATCLQPAAGAQGEWMGLLLIRAYFAERGDKTRRKVIIPDAAHGTNPASAAMCGYEVVSVQSTKDGYVDLAELEKVMDESVAALMLTNPNTLGKFERNIVEISRIVHGAGGLLYYDGANLNAIMGITRPGDMGFDVVHWNLHKTLGTPHGGGGPGSGPVGCKDFLEKYLPPVVQETENKFAWKVDETYSMGRVKAFHGNFLVTLKALCYMLALGGEGLKEASENAVLNANYMLRALEKYSDMKYESPCMHEFVLSLESLKKQTGVTALDVAKALIDYGIHPPTMYFPLIVHEALMFEPTETETVETLDEAVRALEEILKSDPQRLHAAPTTTPVSRPDEVLAARKPKLRHEFDD